MAVLFIIPDFPNPNIHYLAINEWGWVGYEELSRSRRVLSIEAESNKD